MKIHESVPEPWASVYEEVMENDRNWFARHPFADSRMRHYIPGEFWPLRFSDNSRIVVLQKAPGVRARILSSGDKVEPYDADRAAIVEEEIRPIPMDNIQKALDLGWDLQK